MSLSRRSFLAASAAFAATPALGQVPSSGDVDVVIVGAGAAGIAAAQKLRAMGRRFALIEAADRVGGRAITDTRTFGVPYDLGAHFIRSPETNVLMKLGSRTGLELYPAPGGQRLRIGKRYGREGEMEDFLALLVRANTAIAEAARGKVDVSGANALPRDLGEWRASTEFMLGPFGCGKNLEDVSVADLARSMGRGTDSFCRQGLGALLAKLGEGVAVQLSTPASAINTFGRGVVVETNKGRLNGRAAIVTVSTNVLAANKIRFDPALPKRQADALARLQLGHYERVALQLIGNPLQLQSDELVIEKAGGARTAALFANVSNTPLCFVDFGGRFGASLAAQGPAAMIAFAIDWLADLFGADIRKAVGRTHASQWGKEPLVMGAWSVAAPGGAGGRAALREPIRERLYFAGEATHDTLWGTVGGAWESGERAAEAAVKRLGKA